MSRLIAEFGEYEVRGHDGKFKVYSTVACIAIKANLDAAIAIARRVSGVDGAA